LNNPTDGPQDGQSLVPASFRSLLNLGRPRDEGAPQGPAFTPRALLVGCVAAAAIGAGAAYATIFLQGSFMALGFSTVGAVFLLFILAGLINPLLKLIHPRAGLSGGELLLVYIMMVMASPIPTLFASKLLSQITAPFYFATVENQWQTLIHPHIPTWLMPRDPSAHQPFYEGMGPGYPLPWYAWLPTLLAWQPLIWALFLWMIAAMVILRKQWIEYERLVYPLVQVPLAMVQEGEGRWPPFFRNPVMWAGFVLPAIWGTLHGLYAYFPQAVPFAQGVDLFNVTIPILRNTTQVLLTFRFNILGFFYLIKTEVAFSLWFFNLLANVLRGLLGMLGVASSESLGSGNLIGNPILAHQSMGAMLVLFLLGLWGARRHLGAVLRKAFSGDSAVEDSGEILSYRAAVAILIGSSLVLVAWLRLAGLPLWAGLALLFLAAALFVGFTRVVAEGGLSDGAPPVVPATILVSAVGSSAIGAPGLMVLATTYIWTAGARSFVMASCANSLKLAEGMAGGSGKRRLFWAMVLALAVALVASTWVILALGYEHGALNMRMLPGDRLGAYNYVQSLMRYPTEPHLWGWINTGIGAAVMMALSLARWRCSWWPLHPLGYPIGPTWIMDQLWFTMFLAWLIKVLVLKYGGTGLYDRTRPFFLGMILGQLTPGGVFLVVDHLTGSIGNTIFWG